MLKISLLFKENTNFTGDPRLSFKYAPELYFKFEITKNKKHQCMCSEIFFHFRVLVFVPVSSKSIKPVRLLVCLTKIFFFYFHFFSKE